MESCLLCLEINKDAILDCIMVNSTRWHELDIEKIIEKHFWSLNIIQPSSWICLACWREVDAFHKFFLRIEEAHVNFSKMKVEHCAVFKECEEEISIQKLNIKDNGVQPSKDYVAFCFLEPEILIDQTQQRELEIFRDRAQSHELIVDNENVITEPLDEIDLNNMPLKQRCKRIRIQSGPASKDPLEKSKKTKKKKIPKAKLLEEKSTEENKVQYLKIKQEPLDLNDNNSNSITDNDNDVTDVSYQPGKDSSKTADCKRRVRKEHDEFIAKHFKQMVCAICQVPFEDFHAMQKHFTETHNQRGYVVCCKRKFFDRTRLVDHLHCHLNPDHFKCKECGKAVSDRIRLVKHMLRVHRANEVVKQHCCDVCGKSFTEAYVLRTHKLTHLSEEEKKFPCSECGKNYGSPYLLNQHRQVVHLKKFVKICYICGKAINSSAEFKTHMNKHEGIPAPVINCDVCGLRLTSGRSLKLHKETQHPVGGKQDHPCPLCDKISPTARALKKHINTMHEKGFDHKCTMCEKAFRRAETLKEHMASHTGTPLYSCPWCPKTFYSNGNMHAHRKNKHPKEYLESKKQKYN